MTIHFHVPGKKRKELAHAIGQWLGEEVVYMGPPSFAYQIDYFTISKDGDLTFDDRADSEVIERLLEHLYDESFEFDSSEEAPQIADNGSCGVCIALPRQMLDDRAVINLEALLKAKGHLIQKALGTSSTAIRISEEKVEFPWFESVPSSEEMAAYETFICKLCEMAKNQNRINSAEKEVTNEKYAFRCFLLRLGFIGDEFKKERKILLSKLSGSSAFKGGTANELSK